MIAIASSPASRAASSTATTSGDAPDCEMPSTSAVRVAQRRVVDRVQRRRGERDRQAAEPAEHVLRVARRVVGRAARGEHRVARTPAPDLRRRGGDRAVRVGQHARDGRGLLGDLVPDERVSGRQGRLPRRARARSRGCRRARPRRPARPGARRPRSAPAARSAPAPRRPRPSASSSGTPSACRLRTASIIVSTLPASCPSGPRTTPADETSAAAGQREDAVAHRGRGDGVGDERQPPARRAATRPAARRPRRARRRRSAARSRRARASAASAIPGSRGDERAHRVEEVRDGAAPRGRRPGAPAAASASVWPAETTTPRSTSRSISSSAPGSSGASVTWRTSPASSSRTSSAGSGARCHSRGCDAQSAAAR